MDKHECDTCLFSARKEQIEKIGSELLEKIRDKMSFHPTGIDAGYLSISIDDWDNLEKEILGEQE